MVIYLYFEKVVVRCGIFSLNDVSKHIIRIREGNIVLHSKTYFFKVNYRLTINSVEKVHEHFLSRIFQAT
jgi:hypothetical protein